MGFAFLLCWLAIVAAGGDLIRMLVGTSFQGASSFVPWIATGVLAYSWLQIGNASLILSNRLYLAAYVWILCAILCVSLNLYLVPKFGGLGAAITQAIGFVSVAAGIWYFAQAHLAIPVHWLRLLLGFLVSIALGLLMFPAWGQTPWGSLLLKLPAGIACAAIYAWLAMPGFWRGKIGLLQDHSGCSDAKR